MPSNYKLNIVEPSSDPTHLWFERQTKSRLSQLSGGAYEQSRSLLLLELKHLLTDAYLHLSIEEAQRIRSLIEKNGYTYSVGASSLIPNSEVKK